MKNQDKPPKGRPKNLPLAKCVAGSVCVYSTPCRGSCKENMLRDPGLYD